MSMVTRCPACGTTFRVTPQQLQLSQGQVRCGRCMTVFDGFRALATLLETQRDEPAAKMEAVPAPPAVETPAPPPAAEAQAGDTATAGAAVEPASASHEAPATELPAVLQSNVSQRLPESAESVAGGAARDRVRVAIRSHAWTAAATLMLLLLAVQAAYAYRGELVAYYPGLKPAFARFCAAAGCGIRLPQRPESIVIEASDLQVEDPLRPGVIRLTATLRNHADHEVGYPALDLVLTGTQQHALARRIFMPAEYLDRYDAAAGLATHAEVTVRLLLDTGDLGAAGFRLALLPAHS